MRRNFGWHNLNIVEVCRAETWQSEHRTNRQNCAFALCKLWCTQNVWSCPLLLDKATPMKRARNTFTAQHRERYSLWLLLFRSRLFLNLNSRARRLEFASHVDFALRCRNEKGKKKRKTIYTMQKNKSNCIAQNDLFDISSRSTTAHTETTTAPRSHISVLRQTFFWFFSLRM